MVKRFMQSRRTGFYVAVVREGEIGAGDEIEMIERGPGVTIADVVKRRADGER